MPEELELNDFESRTTLELANLAKLGTWLVEGGLASFSEADANLLPIFQCQLFELPFGISDLYLGIKTQKAIESLLIKEIDKQSEEVLRQVLTDGLEDRLRELQGGNEPTSDDQEFISSVQARKDALVEESKEQPQFG